jgi:hypothetical protein
MAQAGFPPSPIPVPHVAVAGVPTDVIVPVELRLPYLLDRALTLCSGLPPEYRSQSATWSTPGNQFLPNPSKPYGRGVLVYRDVPAVLATKVLGKLGAAPVGA